jgi:hypothetical protein
MKITIETNYSKCEVMDENVELMSDTIDLMVQALRGIGFVEETIAEGILDKAQEMNENKIVLVV